MKIKLTTIYVDDLDNALRFYTEVAGFVKKTDVSQGGYRWLTVASPEDPEGTELIRAQRQPRGQGLPGGAFEQASPRPCSTRDDVTRDYERDEGRRRVQDAAHKGDRPTIVQVNDTCGNPIQITQRTAYAAKRAAG
jgi:catechol 2,3-dioxygenase-like lactoylglutathione lyase family enzyme